MSKTHTCLRATNTKANIRVAEVVQAPKWSEAHCKVILEYFHGISIMPGRLPLADDFPSTLSLSITHPPANDQSINILVLLHGLGDSNASFTELGTQLALPETCCISLRAPTPLPFDMGGFHWGDDIVFDPTEGAMELDAGFSKTLKAVRNDVIEGSLVEKCGYTPRDITLFGFGQGGMAALAVTASMPEELGGVISIGGPSPDSIQPPSGKRKTPVLVLGGTSGTLITRSALEDLKKAHRDVEYHKWPKRGDSMPKSREEMMPIMRFFSRRLRSRKGVPAGSLEAG